MLENAGLTPPTRAVNKAAATPASGAARSATSRISRRTVPR